MATVLDKLHQDHINMALLLDLLEQQLEHIRASDTDSDYGLTRDIAHYFATFPDAAHHAIEDEVFGALTAASPDLVRRVARLRNDHAAITVAGKKFHEMLLNVCSGQVVRRDSLASAIEEFLTLQREHMNIEEQEIFPLARAYIDDAVIENFPLEYEAHADPIFGAKVDQYFEQLHAAIVDRM